VYPKLPAAERVGDLVRLKKRGEITMLIKSIESDDAKCVWRQGEQILSGKLPLESLEPVDAAEFLDGSSHSNPAKQSVPE
jgi:hypothetical protein